MQDHPNCTGSHHFYVADIATIEDEGRIAITIVCTNCGEIRSKSIQITTK